MKIKIKVYETLELKMMDIRIDDFPTFRWWWIQDPTLLNAILNNRLPQKFERLFFYTLQNRSADSKCGFWNSLGKFDWFYYNHIMCFWKKKNITLLYHYQAYSRCQKSWKMKQFCVWLLALTSLYVCYVYQPNQFLIN